MFNIFKNFFGSPLAQFGSIVLDINALEPEIAALGNEDLKRESEELRSRATGGALPEELLPRAFALVREASKRTLGQRQFDVQLMGGIALHRGAVAEMATGEGKTLVAVAPAYLNALAGKGMHVVTVNEYLARRDAVWMG
ncbi:MAG: preprotein translocase subunit SecA, partial [Patescibacteria group bacterium]